MRKLRGVGFTVVLAILMLIWLANMSARISNDRTLNRIPEWAEIISADLFWGRKQAGYQVRGRLMNGEEGTFEPPPGGADLQIGSWRCAQVIHEWFGLRIALYPLPASRCPAPAPALSQGS